MEKKSSNALVNWALGLEITSLVIGPILSVIAITIATVFVQSSSLGDLSTSSGGSDVARFIEFIGSFTQLIGIFAVYLFALMSASLIDLVFTWLATSISLFAASSRKNAKSIFRGFFICLVLQVLTPFLALLPILFRLESVVILIYFSFFAFLGSKIFALVLASRLFGQARREKRDLSYQSQPTVSGVMNKKVPAVKNSLTRGDISPQIPERVKEGSLPAKVQEAAQVKTNLKGKSMVKKPSSGLIVWSLNLVILDFCLQVASIGFMISAGVMTGNVDLLYPLVVIIAYLFQSGFFEGSGSFMSIIFLLIVFSLISGAIDVAALVLPIIVDVKNIRHRLPATGILIALATRLLVQVPTYFVTQAGGPRKLVNLDGWHS
ncbi:hypothetical protein HMPREF9176_1705 [Streptococcus downei F0415]|uniref:hypothetical protein n=1 Tax=Streptococcus downei TaxID=1317 RepID=UPI0001E98EF2|nr:hypothetical protein [Streptococcus downei]EFQ57540.1 hypothetical protein HMPREF9176_1705 [Streptococcus downei F0415]